jgi:hypothetical protein
MDNEDFKNFKTFLTEMYFDLLLLEGKGQHQIVKQFGQKIIDKLISEYKRDFEHTIKEYQKDGYEIRVITKPGNERQPPEYQRIPGTEKDAIIELHHPDLVKEDYRKLMDTDDKEKIFKEFAAHLDIPETPNYLDLKKPEDAATWDQHVNWILHRYAHGGIEHSSHIPDVFNDLKEFHRLTKTPVAKNLEDNIIMPGENRDQDVVDENGENFNITDYSDDEEEDKKVEKKTEKEFLANPTSLAKWKNYSDLKKFLQTKDPIRVEGVNPKEYSLVGENEHWHVVIPHTANAACKIGSGTSWCTTSYAYEDYNKKGPLYIFLPKNPEKHDDQKVEKYQLHYEDGQFKNASQIPMSEKTKESIFRKRPIPGLPGKLAKDVVFNQEYDEDGNYIGKTDLNFNPQEVQQLLKNGHIKTVLDRFPSVLSKDDIKKILYGNAHPEIKNLTVQKTKNIHEEDPDIFNKDLVDHLIKQGHGHTIISSSSAIGDIVHRKIHDTGILPNEYIDKIINSYLTGPRSKSSFKSVKNLIHSINTRNIKFEDPIDAENIYLKLLEHPESKIHQGKDITTLFSETVSPTGIFSKHKNENTEESLEKGKRFIDASIKHPSISPSTDIMVGAMTSGTPEIRAHFKTKMPEMIDKLIKTKYPVKVIRSGPPDNQQIEYEDYGITDRIDFVHSAVRLGLLTPDHIDALVNSNVRQNHLALTSILTNPHSRFVHGTPHLTELKPEHLIHMYNMMPKAKSRKDLEDFHTVRKEVIKNINTPEHLIHDAIENYSGDYERDKIEKHKHGMQLALAYRPRNFGDTSQDDINEKILQNIHTEFYTPFFADKKFESAAPLIKLIDTMGDRLKSDKHRALGEHEKALSLNDINSAIAQIPTTMDAEVNGVTTSMPLEETKKLYDHLLSFGLNGKHTELAPTIHDRLFKSFKNHRRFKDLLIQSAMNPQGNFKVHYDSNPQFRKLADDFATKELPKDRLDVQRFILNKAQRPETSFFGVHELLNTDVFKQRKENYEGDSEAEEKQKVFEKLHTTLHDKLEKHFNEGHFDAEPRNNMLPTEISLDTLTHPHFLEKIPKENFDKTFNSVITNFIPNISKHKNINSINTLKYIQRFSSATHFDENNLLQIANMGGDYQNKSHHIATALSRFKQPLSEGTIKKLWNLHKNDSTADSPHDKTRVRSSLIPHLSLEFMENNMDELFKSDKEHPYHAYSDFANSITDYSNPLKAPFAPSIIHKLVKEIGLPEHRIESHINPKSSLSTDNNEVSSILKTTFDKFYNNWSSAQRQGYHDMAENIQNDAKSFVDDVYKQNPLFATNLLTHITQHNYNTFFDHSNYGITEKFGDTLKMLNDVEDKLKKNNKPKSALDEVRNMKTRIYDSGHYADWIPKFETAESFSQVAPYSNVRDKDKYSGIVLGSTLSRSDSNKMSEKGIKESLDKFVFDPSLHPEIANRNLRVLMRSGNFTSRNIQHVLNKLPELHKEALDDPKNPHGLTLHEQIHYSNGRSNQAILSSLIYNHGNSFTPDLHRQWKSLVDPKFHEKARVTDHRPYVDYFHDSHTMSNDEILDMGHNLADDLYEAARMPSIGFNRSAASKEAKEANLSRPREYRGRNEMEQDIRGILRPMTMQENTGFYDEGSYDDDEHPLAKEETE